MRTKDLQSQAIALQNQSSIDVFPHAPPPAAEQEPAAASLQPGAQVTMRPLTIGAPQPPVPTQPLGAPDKLDSAMKAKLPSRRGATGPTPETLQAQVPGTGPSEAEQPPSKRGREDDFTGQDGFAGPSGHLKRTRRDFGANDISRSPESRA